MINNWSTVPQRKKGDCLTETESTINCLIALPPIFSEWNRVINIELKWEQMAQFLMLTMDNIFGDT